MESFIHRMLLSCVIVRRQEQHKEALHVLKHANFQTELLRECCAIRGYLQRGSELSPLAGPPVCSVSGLIQR